MFFDWRSRIFDLTSDFQDGGHYVISRNKVLPPGEWKRRVWQLICSSVRQFLIYSALVLVFSNAADKRYDTNRPQTTPIVTEVSDYLRW